MKKIFYRTILGLLCYGFNPVFAQIGIGTASSPLFGIIKTFRLTIQQ